jgi:hypothetical protein
MCTSVDQMAKYEKTLAKEKNEVLGFSERNCDCEHYARHEQCRTGGRENLSLNSFFVMFT